MLNKILNGYCHALPNPINVEWVQALGANPTPLPFPEVYGAMEQKAIDGQESPLTVIAANKFWEVQKFVALTNHQYNPQSVIFSKKIWDTLSADEKKLLDAAADEAAKYEREQSRTMMNTALDSLKKNGMTVTEFPSAEVAKLREKMKPVVAKFSANVGEATVNEVMAELDKSRK
jgi:TRAP-type C4-dicarboxylate transport system substrate-binding protein